MVVTMTIATVRAAFGLKCSQQLDERGSQTAEHVFDDVIRSNAKSLAAHLGRHMPIPEMPREPRELTRILVGHVDDRFRRRSNDEPRPIIELHAVSIAHCDGSGQIEKDVVALIGNEANPSTMPMVEIESH